MCLGKLTVVGNSNFYYGTESIYLVQTEIKSKSQRIGPLASLHSDPMQSPAQEVGRVEVG